MNSSFDITALWQFQVALLPYVFLALSIVSLWITRRIWLWGSLLALSVILGFFSQRLNIFSLFTIIPLGILFYFCFNHSHKNIRIICGILGFLLSMLLHFHYLPGFNNFQLTNQLSLTADALPYSLFLNFDKPLYGLFILGFGWSFINFRSFSKKTVLITAFFSFITPILMILISMSFDYVRLEPKWTQLFFIWAPINLIFTCIVEEACFRGLVQRGFTQFFANIKFGQILALLLASLLFGLSHIKGGWIYVLLSSIAGLFYGAAYLRTGRIEASIFTHFMLNTVHFLLFTYPALAH